MERTTILGRKVDALIICTKSWRPPFLSLLPSYCIEQGSVTPSISFSCIPSYVFVSDIFACETFASPSQLRTFTVSKVAVLRPEDIDYMANTVLRLFGGIQQY